MGGAPARKIGTIEKLLEKRIVYSQTPQKTIEELWNNFEKLEDK